MRFTKMHGLGNDFILIYGEKELPSDAPARAEAWCNRYFGIGADGLVYILPSERADVMMRMINPDGTEAEQCGNAIRCVAKYIFDNGYVPKEQLSIETRGAGVQKLQLSLDNGSVSTVTVDMGEPVLEGLKIPTLLHRTPVLDEPIVLDGREFRFTAVSMGNPHCIVYVDDAPAFDIAAWGPKLEAHPLFPNRTNVEFATVRSRGYVDMRVWERGAGPTLACGTGACATLVASVLNGWTDRSAVISLKGGDLRIEWSEKDNRVYMTGPSAFVYDGLLR